MSISAADASAATTAATTTSTHAVTTTLSHLSKTAVGPLYRTAIRSIRNTRIAPVVTYLAYKGSGFAEEGVLSGMSISDFVAVWDPQEAGASGLKGKGKVQGKAMRKTNGKGEVSGWTGRVINEKEGRDARNLRQTAHFEGRRRHYCRQEGCVKHAL